MPTCRPDRPAFTTDSERQVWELLRAQLAPSDLLLANLRLTDRRKDHEADLVVAVPGAGVVVVEVKGSEVWHDGESWWQYRGGRPQRIDPVDQARTTKYAVRSYVEQDPRWRDGRTRLRWAHLVVLPHVELPEDFSLPDCPRWSVVDRTQLDLLADVVREVALAMETGNRLAEEDDVHVLAEVLQGRGLPQRDLVARAREREDVAQRLTEEQAVLLGATQLLRRVEVRGGAGSGKTWLAVEQARRLARDGQRVALVCYSRGLAAHLRRLVEGVKRQHRPAYVGEFHGLGHRWGAAPGSDDDSDYWERRLPEQMRDLARALPDGHRFDAVVVDEAQDFADSWWPALLASLRDEEQGALYAFSDEGQRVFARYGRPPVPLVPLLLDHNMRNTRPIAETFNPLAPTRMRLLGGDGPAVRFLECPPGEALARGDDAVDELLHAGWRPEDVALLTTGSRHPEQAERQAGGPEAYWDSFWDADQVFYGHVLGFKGLERRAVVLVLNEREPRERSRERLYVGLSRARDELVVCGDPAFVREVGGDDVLRRLRASRS